ncbi:MAG: bifunctional phosphoribosyl-AMP cyclohydrolase/phosphoribosyl-ATP diphosphatase HisIE [Synergistaceae bacterium]|jgi:phosphoribosyl-ATP pyrophosphohydrolase/phosphoribosyl-AMP cyclohydrolase|nr:bifunctional phosphoribosyl-AMP cyclohydrolase/phosphoribosyl-ATP diphosphatase HisIE [Synergistaceae bacterium]
MMDVSPDFSEAIKKTKFDRDGLVTVVVQDSDTAEVLMVAWANEEALRLTAERGEMVFWSRSRNEIWHKGLTSGNRLKVREIRLDCDGDALLALVEPTGPACHTGERSCFFKRVLEVGDSDAGTFLGKLFRYLETRSKDSPEESYTARLLGMGMSRVAQKVGEEGVETALAVATGDAAGFRYEAADLLYHLQVACIAAGVPFADILKELKSRHKA